jgi:hypothetical protein
MKSRSQIVFCLFALLVVAGCASTKVTDREIYVMGEIPRPAHIWVYDFAATPADVPAGSALAGQYAQDRSPQTSEEIAAGRKLGAEIAAELVGRISDMGMPAQQAMAGTIMQVNDIIIRGYLLSINEGSADMRMAIGFRQGASGLQTAVEAFQVTAQGLRKLGFGTVDSSGGKTPGMAVPAAVAIATANPAGLIIAGAMKAGGEVSGRSTIEGRAKATAKEIADVLKKRFQGQGWIN